MTKFTQIFNGIATYIESEIMYGDETRVGFDHKLEMAIRAWCNQIVPSLEKQRVERYIVQQLQDYEIKDGGYLLYEKLESKNGIDWASTVGIRTLSRYAQKIFNRLDIGNGSTEIIVFIALVITAVSYFIYNINKSQELEPVKLSQSVQSPPAPIARPEPTLKYPPVQSTYSDVKYLLILVVSATQQLVINSLKEKREIDYENYELLYKGTQYLCQGIKSELKSKLDRANQYSSKDESEYDVYLITIELEQANQGFDKGVNQLDRYDAFRELTNLDTKVKVSERLKMEAYADFDVYMR